MIIYEVTATVRADLWDTYERYMLERHIADVLASGRFVEASFEKSDEGEYRARYVAETKESLNDYLSNHAARLRADFSEHLPEGVKVERAEWTVLKRFA